MLQAINFKEEKFAIHSFKEIYEEAFPKSERVPLFLLKRAAKTPRADCVVFFEKTEDLHDRKYENSVEKENRGRTGERKAVGIAYFSHGKDFTYLFFLAVQKEARGKLYGSQILQIAKELFPNRRICLNIEELDENAADFSLRVRRKRFYEKNGFVPCGYKVIENKIVFEMFSYGGKVSHEEYREMLDKCFGLIFSRLYSKFYALCEKSPYNET